MKRFSGIVVQATVPSRIRSLDELFYSPARVISSSRLRFCRTRSRNGCRKKELARTGDGGKRLRSCLVPARIYDGFQDACGELSQGSHTMNKSPRKWVASGVLVLSVCVLTAASSRSAPEKGEKEEEKKAAAAA